LKEMREIAGRGRERETEKANLDEKSKGEDHDGTHDDAQGSEKDDEAHGLGKCHVSEVLNNPLDGLEQGLGG